jgi:Ala-tRNA(Pro) deacylase
MSTSQESVFNRLAAKLDKAGIDYNVLRHDPVYTSEQAAQVRGVPLSSGAKALLVKLGERFYLLVLPADRKLDSQKARKAAGAKRSRFANKQELMDATGLEPGAVPPFGSLFGLPTLCDPALDDNETINFNAGDHCISVQMRFDDYLRVESPQLTELAEK